jgi:nonribosomal peptide synthetase DhbF
MLDILRSEGKALSTLKEHHYEVIKNIYKNNIRLMTKFLPQRFDGDILLFVAKEGEPKPPHGIWSPYVGGRIKVRRIDCTHEAMMEPLPAAKIGALLATELGRQRTTLRKSRRTT